MNGQIKLSRVRFLSVVVIFVAAFALADLLYGGMSFWRDLVERLMLTGPVTTGSILSALVVLIFLIGVIAATVAWRLAAFPPNSLRAVLTGLLFGLTILAMGVASRVAARILTSAAPAPSAAGLLS